MNFVESLNLVGVEGKEIPCITGEGAPTETTEGAVGCFYMDIDTGLVYKCIEANKWQLTERETVEPEQDDIPKIFYGKSLPQTKDDTIMPFRYVSKTLDFVGYCVTKAQGTSSMLYPKKNQTTKIFADSLCTEKKKFNFKGWGKQNKFCLKANWTDITHARNVVSARLWGDVVRARTDFDTLPVELQTSANCGAIDGFPVKVYANGVYLGRYTLNIPKDAWMANMDDELDTHCILCGENYVSGCFRAPANIDETDWSDELHDVVPETIKTRWNEVISFVMNSTDDEFKQNLSNYFDVTSVIDYYIFGLVSCGWDGFGKNQLYLTYNGLKWYATMYDMDYTWGLKYDGDGFWEADFPRESYQDFINDRGGNLLYIRLANLFDSEIRARWEELKKTALSVDNIIRRFEAFTDIAPHDLVAEDYAETTGNGEFTGIFSKDTNNIQQIRNFAVNRLVYVASLLNVNLLENAVFENGYINGNTGESVQAPTLKGAVFSQAYINVSEGEEYYMSVDGITENTGASPAIEISQYDADKNHIGKTRFYSPSNYKASENVTFIRVGVTVVSMGGESANFENAVYSMTIV